MLLDFFQIFHEVAPASVYPGNTLFTVIPNSPNSNESVFAQLATAPRIVFDTPRPLIGCLTEVEIIFIILP